jgi:phospholipid-binding lipoprotein MlaA
MKKLSVVVLFLFLGTLTANTSAVNLGHTADSTRHYQPAPKKKKWYQFWKRKKKEKSSYKRRNKPRKKMDNSGYDPFENDYDLIGIGKQPPPPKRRKTRREVKEEMRHAPKTNFEHGLIGIGKPHKNFTPLPKKAKPSSSRKKVSRLERYNRWMFRVNDRVDRAILKPIAKWYRKLAHKKIRRGVRNVFSNLDDVFVTANDVLQFKPVQATQDAIRFVVNSTVGIFGIFDVARHMGLEKHNEDFGQTLGVWGIKSGPYVVLPLLGPSTVRDMVGTGVHYAAGNNAKAEGIYIMDPKKHIKSTPARYGVTGLSVISKRESLLDLEKTLDTIAIDRYGTIRDTYLQHREYLVTDGKVPEKPLVSPENSITENEDDFDKMLAEDEALLGGDDDLELDLEGFEEDVEAVEAAVDDDELDDKLNDALEKELDDWMNTPATNASEPPPIPDANKTVAPAAPAAELPTTVKAKTEKAKVEAEEGLDEALDELIDEEIKKHTEPPAGN